MLFEFPNKLFSFVFKWGVRLIRIDLINSECRVIAPSKLVSHPINHQLIFTSKLSQKVCFKEYFFTCEVPILQFRKGWTLLFSVPFNSLIGTSPLPIAFRIVMRCKDERAVYLIGLFCHFLKSEAQNLRTTVLEYLCIDLSMYICNDPSSFRHSKTRFPKLHSFLLRI